MSVQEVYFCQSKTGGRILKQRSGIGMGAKQAQELANLYCYQCEAEFIDYLIAKGQEDEARKWFNTWRFIDDMIGWLIRNWLNELLVPN